MASCLVTDFPAVVVAVEHLKELEKQLKDEALPFALEASLHLAEMTNAITKLENERHTSRELLEVESIENSKLRHQINNVRECMSREIMADVAAARASNEEEKEQLLNDLNTALKLQKECEDEQEALSKQTRDLYPLRDQVRAEYQEMIAALNDRISQKYDLQTQLGQKQEQVERLKACISANEHEKTVVHQVLALEKGAFSVRKHDLTKELHDRSEKIKQQKHLNRRSRRKLESVTKKKREAQHRLEELTADMTRLEGNLQRLTTSRCGFEEQLQETNQKHRDLKRQRETLKEEWHQLGEGFTLAIQHLREKVSSAEGHIEIRQTSRSVSQDQLACVSDKYQSQHYEENKVKTEHIQASQQLEHSQGRLEERIALVVKYSKEIVEMDKQLRELLEADMINQHVFKKNQEELSSNICTEEKNICHFEEERSKLWRHLEKARLEQEEHMRKVTSDIISTRRRHEELLQEEATLLQVQPMSADVDLLLSHRAQCEAEFKDKELKSHQDIEQCVAEMEKVSRSTVELLREVTDKEGVLKDVEVQWKEEQRRQQRAEQLTSELKLRKAELVLGIQELKEKNGPLLQPKEDMKVELQNLRAHHMDLLENQALELRAVEMTICDCQLKLEQVYQENSRLHLCITHMTEDVRRARMDQDRYWQQVQLYHEDNNSVIEGLQEDWAEDLRVTEQSQRRDAALLDSFNALWSPLETRRQQLGHVDALLHRQMMDFSRRLGGKTMGLQESDLREPPASHYCQLSALV